MYQRFIEEHLREALGDRPVVFLRGPRQSGKSTLAQLIASTTPHSRYLTLDDPTVLAHAREDPVSFVEQGDGLFIIDEVQRAPDLFLAIKASVDRNRKPGRFLLTGSADILLLPQLSRKLVGRMEVQTLYPLALEEIEGEKSHLIPRLFSPEGFRRVKRKPRTLLLKRLISGGYPELQGSFTQRRRTAWFHSYLSSLLQREVLEMAQIEDLTRLPRLLKLLATRSGGLLNTAELSRSAGLATSTLRRDLALIETLFLVHTLPAWSNHRGKRLIKAPKPYFHDTGLMAHLLGLDEKGISETPDQWGRLFETLVISELLKQASWSEPIVNCYHFRTASGQEVDLVLEAPDGTIVGIEIKAGATLGSHDYKGLRALAEIAGNRFVHGVIFYLGEETLSMGDRLSAIPW